MEQTASEPLPVWGDPKLLFQTFSNLIANAVKYAPGSPKIVLISKREANRITIAIEDNDIGIPANDVSRIFERYYRGSNVSGFVGNGIGLFLVATVVRLHDGDIAVESTEGKGSWFMITLTPSS